MILRQTEKGVRGRRTDPGTPGTRGPAARPSCLRAAGPARPIRRPRSLSRRIAGLPRAPCRRRREPAPGRGSRGRGARARPGEGEGTGRVTWARAMARGVRAPAGASPRGRRARRSPGGPERSSAPAPKRPGQAAPPRGRAAARAGRAASSSRAAPRRGASLAGRPGPLTRSPTPGGYGAEGREGRGSRERADANASSATRAAPLPQRRRRPGPRFCCQLVERTLSMRARRPHPGNFRAGPFPPAAFLSPGCPRLPPAVTGGSLCAGAHRGAPVGGLPRVQAWGPALWPCREALPGNGGGKGCLEGMVTREIGVPLQKSTQAARENWAYSGRPVSAYN